jgi:hypothetical protein
MKRLILCAAVLALLTAGLAGCGGESSQTASQGNSEGPPVASNFHPDVAELYGGQKACPVCGGAIKEEHYVDVQDMRVYFDKKACVDKFKEKYEQPLSSREVGQLRDTLMRQQMK